MTIERTSSLRMRPVRALNRLALALLLAACACQARAELQGRLFLTPERRASLEQQRQSQLREERSAEGDTLSLDGVVRRSSGKNTVWINRRAQHENGSATPRRAASARSARLHIDRENTQELRVGETLQRGSGEKTDLLKPGALRIKRFREQTP